MNMLKQSHRHLYRQGKGYLVAACFGAWCLVKACSGETWDEKWKDECAKWNCGWDRAKDPAIRSSAHDTRPGDNGA